MEFDGSKYNYEWGNAATPHNMVRVNAARGERTTTVQGNPVTSDERVPMFFGPVLGISKAEVGTSAVASFQPRDMMVVLDFSGSMNDDSTLAAINHWGKAAVEENLLQIWQELGSPTYGSLTFTPNYLTRAGQPASGNKPHIDVTFKGTEVYVSSTTTINHVELEFSDGTTETINGSATTGTFKGASSKRITGAWVKSNGAPSEWFDLDDDAIKAALGLGTYPYPGGSWDEYIDYANDDNGQAANAGYRWKYGYLTWINYLLESRASYADTPDLWKTTNYPSSALKSGVDVFVDYLKANAIEDKVGLAVYSTSSGSQLEFGLTTNVAQLSTITQQRQPGHYDPYTNIYAGMKAAREELVSKSRSNAAKYMVLMTDGLANRPTDESTAKTYVRNEAALAKEAKITIMTISLGFKADPTLMQEVADITGGYHYNVPGGSSADVYVQGMKDTFVKIGASRPLRLVSVPN